MLNRARLYAISLLWLAACAVVLGGGWGAAPSAILALALVVSGRRWQRRSRSYWILALVVLGPTVLLTFAGRGPMHTPLLLATMGTAALATQACLELTQARLRATSALGLFVLLGLGYGKPGLAYIGACVPYLALTGAMLRSWDATERGHSAERSRKRWWGDLALGLCIASLVSLAAIVAIPRAFGAIGAAIERAYLGNAGRLGLSGRIQLGSMRNADTGDAIVLRLWGDSPELLRASTYDVYEAGGFRRSRQVGRGAGPERVPPLLEQSKADGPRIEWLGGGESLYLPWGYSVVAVDPSMRIRVEADGTVATTAQERSVRYIVAPNAEEHVAPPTDEEVALTVELRAKIVDALPWILPLRSEPQALAASEIERRIRTEHAYSLNVDRTAGVDPVVDFLTLHRAGHCEYFASAMVLGLRAIGIPARVVGGYRASEAGLGYRVARERHAHAWVEAWVDSTWTTHDPTPAIAASDSGLSLDHLSDAIRALWSRTTWGSALAWPLAVLVAAAAVRALGIMRRVRARRPPIAAPPRQTHASPLIHSARRALGSLEARYGKRPPAETLANFRRRVATPEDASLLSQIERVLYGQADDETSERALARFVGPTSHGKGRPAP